MSLALVSSILHLKNSSFSRVCHCRRIKTLSPFVKVTFIACSIFIHGTIAKPLISFKRKTSDGRSFQTKVKKGFGFFPSKINRWFVRYHVPTVNARLISHSFKFLASTLLPRNCSIIFSSGFKRIFTITTPSFSGFLEVKKHVVP